MKIQIITENSDINYNNYEVNNIGEPKAFDMFDLNIIDISSDYFWKKYFYSYYNYFYLNYYQDLNYLF